MDAPKTKRGPGRPPKMQEEEVLVEPSQTEDIKHVMRVLAIPGNEYSQGDLDGPFPPNVVEDHLAQNYFAQGYTLSSSTHIRVVVGEGERPIGHEMLYVLVKYAQ